jgi:tetratricopeptide (TPR) repeat protein
MASGILSAQPENLINAYNYYRTGELSKAKITIDKATLHERTMNNTKTWRYRGDIYLAILNSPKPELHALHPNPALIAYESYMKAKELDPNGSNNSEMDQKLYLIQNMSLNKGVAEFNEKNYDLAYEKFYLSVIIADNLGRIDSLAVYNCGLAAERGGQTDLAIEWYNRCLDINYRPVDMCSFIIFLLQQADRHQEAKEKVYECRSKFPDDQNLIVSELNIFLRDGDYEAAERNLLAALANDPDNHILHFSLGSILDNQGRKEEAEASYLRALMFKEDYFDANYNLGALYFNEGVELNNKAVNTPGENAANELHNKSIVLFKKALPYLERARELHPDDINTINSLNALQARLGNTH